MPPILLFLFRHKTQVAFLNDLLREKLEGAKPLQNLYFPLSFKERGIKGVRLIINLSQADCTYSLSLV